jgi:hypothetical protein
LSEASSPNGVKYPAREIAFNILVFVRATVAGEKLPAAQYPNLGVLGEKLINNKLALGSESGSRSFSVCGYRVSDGLFISDVA